MYWVFAAYILPSSFLSFSFLASSPGYPDQEPGNSHQWFKHRKPTFATKMASGTSLGT
jgi:hypothetical protein